MAKFLSKYPQDEISYLGGSKNFNEADPYGDGLSPLHQKNTGDQYVRPPEPTSMLSPPPSVDPINVGSPSVHTGGLLNDSPVTAPPGEIDPAQVPDLEDPARLGEFTPAEATLREVQDNELVQNQIESLLSGDGRYINNARLRGAELAARRGRFGSSLLAGDAERAAIEAAMPIATADAQAYRDVGSQNQAVQNQITLANLAAETQRDTAQLNADTQTFISKLAAYTDVSIANLQSNTSLAVTRLNNIAAETMNIRDNNTRIMMTNLNNQAAAGLAAFQARVETAMQERSLNHDSAMEAFRQDGRMQLANLDANLRRELQQAGFTHDINLTNLTADRRLELETLVQDYNDRRHLETLSFQREAQANAATMALYEGYMNGAQGFGGITDDAGRQRFIQLLTSGFQGGLNLIEQLYGIRVPLTPNPGGG